MHTTIEDIRDRQILSTRAGTPSAGKVLFYRKCTVLQDNFRDSGREDRNDYALLRNALLRNQAK